MQTINIMQDNKSKQQNVQDFIFTVDDLPESIQPKLLPLAQLLNLETTPVPQLKSLLAQGIPEQAARIRQFAWKIALNYLPKQRKLWHQQIAAHEQIYRDLVQQYLSPAKYHSPFVPNKNNPQWKLYEHDLHLWDQIQKDTCRTQAQLAFFSTIATPFPLPFLTNTRKQKLKLILGTEHPAPHQLLQTYRYDYLTRILFILARLNPKVQYVQGMNELIAPIYYLLHHHQPPRAPPQEAAAFFMLNNVISDVLEMHMRDFSLQENPVHGRLTLISNALLALEPKTWQRLDSLKIDPFYCCFRWLTLLFAQEFEMYETLRLWESIFSHDDRTAYTNFLAVALLLASRDAIATQDYSTIMAHLKNINLHVQIEDVIIKANQLYGLYRNVDMAEMAEKNRRKMKEEGGRLARFLRKLF